METHIVKRLVPILLAALWLGSGGDPAPAAPTVADRAVPRYAHVFVIVEENRSYGRIVGSADAPRISALARRYGSASQMFGEVHPSEGNYIAMVGGSTFGIHDDDAWYCVPQSRRPNCGRSGGPDYASHSLDARSLPEQLRERGLDWRGYFGSLPAPGSLAIFNTATASQAGALYAAKHNPFVNFNRLRTAPDFAQHVVAIDRLFADLAAGKSPAFSFVVPNQCDEMHGLGGAVGGPVPAECSNTAKVQRRGDAVAGRIVDAILNSRVWRSPENVAIVVTFDEDDRSTVGVQGCCGWDPKSPANFGGGRIPLVVVTNHGPRGVVDPTAYNHYSLLRTLEDAFGIDQYLELAGATEAGVKPMLPLFRTAKSPGSKVNR
jgi:phospholipase C